MDVPALLARLERFPAVLDALLGGTPAHDWRWRPPEGGWSLVEVVHHLVDEEVEDFRVRVRSMLEDPARPWPPLDPEALVTSRGYQDRDGAEGLRRFREERARSMAWLVTVIDGPWSNSRQHARVGPIHAGDLMASWAAHDARHLGQIAKRLHGLAARDGAPYSVQYAG